MSNDYHTESIVIISNRLGFQFVDSSTLELEEYLLRNN